MGNDAKNGDFAWTYRYSKDPAEHERICHIFRDFARCEGWPKIVRQELDQLWVNRLKDVEGTFINEYYPAGIPIIHPVELAAYDLIPELLEDEGNHGKELVFGYGRRWFVVSDTTANDSYLEGKWKLVQTYPYQIPYYDTFTIAKETIETPWAKRYYTWKHRAADEPVDERQKNVLLIWIEKCREFGKEMESWSVEQIRAHRGYTDLKDDPRTVSHRSFYPS